MSQLPLETTRRIETILCEKSSHLFCSQRAYPAVADGRDRYAECVTEEKNKCLGIDQSGTPSPTPKNMSSPIRPAEIIATIAGGALGYYIGKDKSQNIKIIYAVLGAVVGFALFKSSKMSFAGNSKTFFQSYTNPNISGVPTIIK